MGTNRMSAKAWDAVQVVPYEAQDSHVALPSAFAGRKAVVVLVRRFGCAMCHETMSRLLKLKRLGMWDALKRFLFSKLSRAYYAKIEKNHPTSNLKGDGLQTGGVFVVDDNKDFLYEFRENDNEIDEHADQARILEVLASGNPKAEPFPRPSYASEETAAKL